MIKLLTLYPIILGLVIIVLLVGAYTINFIKYYRDGKAYFIIYVMQSFIVTTGIWLAIILIQQLIKLYV